MKLLLIFLASLLLAGKQIERNTPNTVFVGFDESLSETEKIDIMDSWDSLSSSVHLYEHIPNLALVTVSNDNIGEFEMVANANSMISFVERDRVFTATRHEVIPNDAGFSLCWGHRNTGSSGLANFDMKTSKAWSITQGVPEVRVMIFETGVQQDHPDINQLPGRDFTTGAVNGVAGGGPSNSCDNHGTAVAGCVSGIINNSIGTVGVAPNAKVISAKVGTAITPCNGSWQGQTSWTVNAINWGIANGVRVTNNSNDYGTSSSAMNTAYSAAKNSGMIHFASSGNSGNTSIGYPATSVSVVAVGASNRSGQRASFSSYGNKLAFVAAGQSVYTTDRTGTSGYGTGNYVTIDGTSFSSPYAAGVAALILSVNPNLTSAEVEQIMKSTCRDMESAGYDTFTGWGMLNAEAAVMAALPCEEDLNDDRNVNGTDLGMLLSAWGTPTYDLTGDNIVDGNDLGKLLSAWGSCN